jgi:hypothetical protein
MSISGSVPINPEIGLIFETLLKACDEERMSLIKQINDPNNLISLFELSIGKEKLPESQTICQMLFESLNEKKIAIASNEEMIARIQKLARFLNDDSADEIPTHVQAGIELLIKQNVTLHKAAEEGDSHVVKILLRGGVDLDKEDEYTKTPLHIATLHGHEEVVKLLVEGGANVDKFDFSGVSPMHLAVMKCHESIVEILIQKGAHVDQGDKDKTTPLFYAVTKGNLPMTKLLIEHGANVNHRNSNYYKDCPLKIAKRQGHQEIIELLRKHGAYEDNLSM